MLSLQASADPVEINGIYYYLSGRNASVAPNPNGKYSGDIIIPESFTNGSATYSVISIGDGAFSGCNGLTSITIPNSVTRLDNFAFEGCSGLTSITIPNSVTSIGEYILKGCSGLTSITIPNSVTRLGSSAFDGTAWYDNQPEGVVYADQIAYKYKGEMPANTTISLKEGTTGIADDAFSVCSGLTSVAIPNSVTFIGHAAFAVCSGLTSVTIPNSVTDIGIRSFQYCSGLESIVVESGNPVYDSRENCNAIIKTADNCLVVGCKTTVIPNSVTSIGDDAFFGCRDLTTITIPNSVTSIGYCSFASQVSASSYLTSVTCLATTPPQAYEHSFQNYDIPLYVPTGTRDAYLAASPWNKFKEIVELGNTSDDTDEEVIKISSALQTTYCSESALDFTGVEGIKAYVASGYDRDNGTIWLMRVFKVPANEGILLMGDEGEYKVPRKGTNTYYANFMKGTLEPITINETEGEYTNYYLSNGTSGVGFYKVEGTRDIGANRAYLPLLKGTTQSGTRFIGIEFEDDGTTGVKEVKSGEVKGEEWFTLQGQRVAKPGKGLYIQNGKKVMIK